MQRTASYRASLLNAIRQWLPPTFFAQWRVRSGTAWTAQRVAWMAVLMAWSVEQTLADRFAAVRDLLRTLFSWWSLGRTFTGWTDALARWSPRVQPALARHLRRQMQAVAGRHWTREGWCAVAVDGSRIDCPRTAANQRVLGCAGKKRTAPQLYLTTLWHMGLGTVWDYRVGPGTASERDHLTAMLPDLPPQALVVADAGFTGYALARQLDQAGQGLLLRVGRNVHLLRQLGLVPHERKSTVYLWPSDQRGQPPLVLRLLVVGPSPKPVYLLTNVRTERRLPKTAAAVLYQMRWGVEVFFRSCKQTLQRRKMLSQAPAQAEQELTWTVLGVWLLGLLSVAAILARGGDPLAWSVALARKRVREAMRWALSVRRCPQPLTVQLGLAVRDRYVRHGDKAARDWPHPKRQKPPGPPKVRTATADEVKRAQRLREKSNAA